MRKAPLLIGGLALAAGYAWSLVRRVQRPISRELVAFRRHEQMLRLKNFLSGNRVPPQSRARA